MRLVTLDFETYFDDRYSLSKMTTEEYVRDERFKAHGCAFKIDDGPARWYAPGFEFWSLIDRIKAARPAILCHHAHFDGLILSAHYGVDPSLWLDTLSMARMILGETGNGLANLARRFSLAPKDVPYHLFKSVRTLSPEIAEAVGAGCAHDVELTHQIFKRLAPLVPREELRVIDQTIRMFTRPLLRLDTARAAAFLQETRDNKDFFLAAAGVSEFECSSTAKFSEALRRIGVEPPMKASPSDPTKEIPAIAKTDAGMRELLEHDDARVQALAAARMGVKSTINETRAERLLGMAERGALPIYLKYAGAHTLRFSGGDKMNFQNLTPALKKCIVAPPGYRIVTVDAAQVECRGLNWFSGQADVLEKFARGEDLYSQMASEFYGREITKADKTERHLGKTMVLGCGFGMGHVKFRETCRRGALGGPPIDLDEREARQAIDLYRAAHPRNVQLWGEGNRIIELLASGGEGEWRHGVMVRRHALWLPNGAPLWYRGLRRTSEGWTVDRGRGPTRVYGALVVENIIQALFSGLLIRQAMLRIDARYPIVLQVHDDVSFLAPEDEADDALAFGIAEMERVPAWAPGIPLKAEGGHSERYDK